MTEEEKNKIRLEMRENLENQFKKVDLFWQDEYPNYSFEQKIGYWSASLHQQMRWQAESGLDPYVIFSPGWHKWAKEQDLDLDNIIDIAFDRNLAWEWDKKEYLKRI